jgi:hypothetical protein
MAGRGASGVVEKAAEERVTEGAAGAGATAEAGAATAAGDRRELTGGDRRELAGDRREIALLRDAIKYTDSMRAFDVQSREALAWSGAHMTLGGPGAGMPRAASATGAPRPSPSPNPNPNPIPSPNP